MMGVPVHTPGVSPSQSPPPSPASMAAAPAIPQPQANLNRPVPLSTMMGNAFSGQAPANAPPAVANTAAPAIAPMQPVAGPSAPAQQFFANPAAPIANAPVAAPFAAPVVASPAAAVAQQRPASDRGNTGRNRAVAGTARAEELLADAFEATQDLAFLHEPEEACTFVATLTRDLLKSPCVAVSVYDIDKDELVLQTAEGSPASAATLGRRIGLKAGPRGQAALRGTVVTLATPPPDEQLLGADVPSGPVLYVAARHDRRLFGVLELHRAAGAAPYTTDEEHTALYIATQLGQFLADHSKRVGFKEDRGSNRR
jgi:hypothetical protein